MINKKVLILADTDPENVRKLLAKYLKDGKTSYTIHDRDTQGLQLTASIVKGKIKIVLSSVVSLRTPTRHTVRKQWYCNNHRPNTPLTALELKQIKADAQQFYDETCTRPEYKPCNLADFTDKFIRECRTPNTAKVYTSALSKLTPFLNTDIKKIDIAEVLRHLSATCTPYGYKQITTVFNTFLNFCFKQSLDKAFITLTTELRLLKSPTAKAAEPKHFKSIESVNNAELENQLIQRLTALYIGDHSDNKAKYNQTITHLLLACRPSECTAIAAQDIHPEYVHLTKTKTITKDQGGFKIPITPRAYNHIKNNLAFRSRSVMIHAFNKHMNMTIHGIRSLFQTYCERLGQFNNEYIDACLSHKTGGIIAQAYRQDAQNYFFEKRKEIMTVWQSFIFSCADQAEDRANQRNITSFRSIH